ncbi:insulinase family protein [Anabaena cylindrica FACHB-243]|uniref:Processing peptidase n=2 Tax=Anabaena TaxID=1163 RepID=K9ZMP5_ANACC|nr:processing peptidase [Anabaena cylindrica PCC 7122]MBD2417208.1 insulinase family protein [Anabaena cylindrica FACHB-243]MBY5282292.1 insulinase family protein [Anabaena sp. CCAP 1446/1C]MBY5309782.1 insulinase family protein [Anabaena sp. CCAP 1446/1C]BAY03141.1 peptidase M16 domain-containing protein [Anabaena cylindrica PCC 7122]
MLLGLCLSLILSVVPLSGNFTNAATPAVTPVSALSFTQGVQKTVLENGLTVLTKEVHTAPVVSVQVWYKVGSRNEGNGESGISHQLEHLMFKGTTDRPVQFGRLFSALGSQFNAFTSFDETAYFGTVQRDKLEALLTLESDRMKNALIGSEELTSEKRVVISELQGYENSPEYRLDREVRKAAFPNRAYGLSVGGTKADVEKFTVDQVRNYYQTYYSPDNATLVVTGDFTTAPTLKSIKATFGKLPKGEKTTLKVSPAVTAVNAVQKTPIVLKQPGSAALLQAVYPLPDIKHPDVPAIDVMDAILTGGRSSRLYQALIESGLASSVSGYAAELIEPGWYDISATAAPGQELSKITAELQASLTKLQQQPVTAEELNRAKTQLQASYILNNQDISSQASQLAYNQVIAGDYHYIEKYLSAIAQVTPQDVQRVAQKYLNPAKQTIGYFEPTQADGQPGTSSGGAGRTTENFSPGQPVDPAELAKYLPPSTSATNTNQQSLPQNFTLANGLKVLLLKDSSLPTINISGQINAGNEFDGNQKAGLANLTATNLMNGTKTKNALTLAQSLEDRGASLSFRANREGLSINGQGLSANLPILVETLADVVQNANFPSDQLELSRQRELISLKVQLDDPRTLGRRVFQQAIYPENHPFHSFPTVESLENITRDDVVSFYQTHYRPDATTLTLVGDFEPMQVKSLLNKAFEQWQPQGKPPVINFNSVKSLSKTQLLNPVIPGKSEAVTYLGYNGISRTDPRYYAALILNQILGGDTLSSRLGTEVRDRLGLTYGIYSGFAAGINPGPFLISMQTAPSDTQKAIASTIALLKQLRNQGITEAEFNTAKRSLTNSYPVDLANPSEMASIILNNAVSGLSTAEIREFPQRIQAVTMNQVQKAIEELIQPENLVIVTAGP